MFVSGQRKMCFKCGKNGHMRSDCLNDGIWCYRCRRFGNHISTECRAKRPQPGMQRSTETREKTPAPLNKNVKWGEGIEKKPNLSLTHRRLKRVKEHTARRISANRKVKGRANLVVYKDDDTKHQSYDKRMVWVNADKYDRELQDEEEENIHYARDDDDQGDTSIKVIPRM